MTQPELPQIHLKPGELLVTRDACMVVTVLGSCLSVTMFNARLQFAAICHAMLPEPRLVTPAGTVDPQQFKYLSAVIPTMAARFKGAGIDPTEVEVKIFGGGNVISPNEGTPSDRWLGNVNIEVARTLLLQQRLHIKASNVGGRRGRKILFNTQTGEVLHKHLARPARQPKP
jgi:chemotaxis protein CheD